MNTERNDPKSSLAGPQGTTLFQAGELAEIIASPSADTEGDIERAALVGITPPFRDQRFVLGRGKTTVGRREDNDIILPDGSVSVQHAWILQENGQYRVMNMLSTNGIYINGEKVHEAPLHEGDRIRFGRAEFVFRGGALGDMQANKHHVPLWVWAGSILVLALIAVAFILS